MKTFSIICCLFLTAYGCITAVITGKDINDFAVGSILMCIGSLAFIIISMPTKKIDGYNPKDFMNR